MKTTPAVIDAPATVPAEAAPASDVIAFLAMVERAARDPNADIDKMERLLVWREKELARIAEQQWWRAMTATQKEMEPVRAECVNEQTRNSKYADLAALDAALRPIWTKHGLCVTQNTCKADSPDEIRIYTYVGHTDGGHVREYSVDMPCDGKGAKGGGVMSPPHARMSAITYGRRAGLGMAFNIPVTKDDDGNAAGGRKTAPPRQFEHRPPMGPPTQALPPRHAVHRDMPRFNDVLREEFPSPNNTAYRPRQGPMSGGAEPDRPTEMIRKLARAAAGKGREAFRSFCPTVTRTEYAAGVQPILSELERIVNDAELEIPANLRRR